MKFRCCFEKCKYKHESLLGVFEHMKDKHKLEVGKDVFQDLKEGEGK